MKKQNNKRTELTYKLQLMMILQTIFSSRYGNTIMTTLLIVLYGISFKKTLRNLLWIYSLKLVLELLRTFSSSFIREEYIYIKITNILNLYKS